CEKPAVESSNANATLKAAARQFPRLVGIGVVRSVSLLVDVCTFCKLCRCDWSILTQLSIAPKAIVTAQSLLSIRHEDEGGHENGDRNLLPFHRPDDLLNDVRNFIGVAQHVIGNPQRVENRLCHCSRRAVVAEFLPE